MDLIDKQEADTKKTVAKAAAKEAKAATKAGAAKERADTEMKDVADLETQVNGQAETAENTDEAPKEPTTEDAPISEQAAPEEPAEPEFTYTLAREPSVPAPVEEQPAKDISQPEHQVDGEKSTESGINGQSTAERITSVFAGAFLAN